jgi:hypothetical protein
MIMISGVQPVDRGTIDVIADDAANYGAGHPTRVERVRELREQQRAHEKYAEAHRREAEYIAERLAKLGG